VNDTTNTLFDGERQQLEDKLAALEKRKGSQVVVLMVTTTKPEDIASYANRVANTWKIGRKGVGDGVLVVVAKGDRKLRIEVAKALEGAIPDLAAKQIIDEALAPRLKAGDYAGGLSATIDQITQRIDPEALPVPSAASAPSTVPAQSPNDLPSASQPAPIAQKQDLPSVPQLTGHVMDATESLDASTIQKLEAKLARLEHRIGSKVVLLMVETTTYPENLDSYGNRVAQIWGIGRPDMGHGVLILVARENGMRVKVGKNLGGAFINSSTFSRGAEEADRAFFDPNLVPYVEPDVYAKGLIRTIDRIADQLESKAEHEAIIFVQVRDAAQFLHVGPEVLWIVITVVGFFIFILVIRILARVFSETFAIFSGVFLIASIVFFILYGLAGFGWWSLAHASMLAMFLLVPATIAALGGGSVSTNNSGGSSSSDDSSRGSSSSSSDSSSSSSSSSSDDSSSSGGGGDFGGGGASGDY
jgi:uncharacterized membrane protein YgcG